MATDVITHFRGDGGTRPVDVITHLRGRTRADRTDVITRFRGSNAAGLTVAFAPPLKTTANPFEIVALTVAPSLPADTVTVTQTAGPTVSIQGAVLDRWAKMPAQLTSSTLTFLATVTKAGYAAATATYSITVAAHGGLYRKNGTGVEWRSRPPPPPGFAETASDTFLDDVPDNF